MKVLIDIPEDIRVAIGQMGLLRIPDEMQKTVDKAIQHSIPIPDNATNGEVLKALFPNERIGHCEDCTDLGDIATFDDDWWNAPY